MRHRQKALSKSSLVVLLIATFAEACFGDSLYPASPLRLYGIYQGVSPSCQAEAAVNAIENQFARGGVRYRISRMHLFYWLMRNKGLDPEIFQSNVDSSSDTVTNDLGPIVPELVAPEDGEGINLRKEDSKFERIKVMRPGVYQFGEYVWDGEVFNNNPLVAKKELTYFEHSDIVGELKRLINLADTGVVLSMDANNFGQMWDTVNGWYVTSEISKNNSITELNHSVALVGYDDKFGSFIFMNSWTNRTTLNKLKNSTFYTDMNGLGWRRRFLQKNNPGYYLMPYSHVMRMNSIPGIGVRITTYKVNRNAMEVRQRYYSRYLEVGLAPYICSSNVGLRQYYDALTELKNLVRKLDGLSVNESNAAREKLEKLVKRQIDWDEYSSPKPLFYFAKIPMYKGGYGPPRNVPSTYEAFYADKESGKNRIQSYYCPEPGTVLKPQLSDLFGKHSEYKSHMSRLGQNPTSASAWFDFYVFVGRSF